MKKLVPTYLTNNVGDAFYDQLEQVWRKWTYKFHSAKKGWIEEMVVFLLVQFLVFYDGWFFPE